MNLRCLKTDVLKERMSFLLDEKADCEKTLTTSKSLLLILSYRHKIKVLDDEIHRIEAELCWRENLENKTK